MDYAKARQNMVDCQIHTSGIVDPNILEPYKQTPRERFVPEKLKGLAYMDEDLHLGNGRYLMEPSVHARMVEACMLDEHDTVLDVGAAYGYSSAIMARHAKTVFALDNDNDFAEFAAGAWHDIGTYNAVYFVGDLTVGDPDHAPFSTIFFNGALACVPDHYFEQLASGGRLCCVVRPDPANVGCAILYQRLENTTISQRNLFDAAIPYLPGFEPTERFEFA